MWTSQHPYPPGHQQTCRIYECPQWSDFFLLIDHLNNLNTAFGARRTVYRGQNFTNWYLQSLWERKFYRSIRAGLGEVYAVQRDVLDEDYKSILRFHLASFKARAIQVSLSLSELNDDQWWAYARHHGLWTPLLDWTHDANIAAYFAFAERDASDTKTPIAIWALPLADHIRDGSYLVWGDWAHPTFSRRQKAQHGLFTRLSSPIFADLENYIRNVDYRFASSPYPLLAKIEISSSEAARALAELAAKGIDDQTLLLAKGIDNQLDQLDVIAQQCNSQLSAAGRPRQAVEQIRIA
jgi:hypothetical protein